MRARTLALLLSSALAAAPAVIAQTMPNPAFVVPSFPDLTIKKRISADPSSSGTTEVLYLKGARERRELLHGRPASTRSAHITQCDQRRSVQLNAEAKLYGVFGFQERSEQVN